MFTKLQNVGFTKILGSILGSFSKLSNLHYVKPRPGPIFFNFKRWIFCIYCKTLSYLGFFKFHFIEYDLKYIEFFLNIYIFWNNFYLFYLHYLFFRIISKNTLFLWRSSKHNKGWVCHLGLVCECYFFILRNLIIKLIHLMRL